MQPPARTRCITAATRPRCSGHERCSSAWAWTSATLVNSPEVNRSRSLCHSMVAQASAPLRLKPSRRPRHSRRSSSASRLGRYRQRRGTHRLLTLGHQRSLRALALTPPRWRHRSLHRLASDSTTPKSGRRVHRRVTPKALPCVSPAWLKLTQMKMMMMMTSQHRTGQPVQHVESCRTRTPFCHAPGARNWSAASAALMESAKPAWQQVSMQQLCQT